MSFSPIIKTFSMTVCLALGAAAVLKPGRVFADELDLDFISINQLATTVIRDDVVALSMKTLLKNVGEAPITWGFPVIETFENPWIAANSFPGPSHAHRDEVGRHPHMRFYLYRQSSPDVLTVRISASDLKHGSGVSITGPHHEIPVGVVDVYGVSTNQNQSFYGPVEEMDPLTYEVAAHEHFGGIYPELGPGYHRDHGLVPFSGDSSIGMPADPGHVDTNGPDIDHLLQAPLDLLMPADGVRWWLAGEVFVVGDINQRNNQRWTEVFPIWNGFSLRFTSGDSELGLDTIPHVITTGLLGDLDLNGKVDILDFGIFAGHFGQLDTVTDLNNDGKVDILDFGIFADQFGEGSTGGAITTPEPATLLLLIGAISLLWNRQVTCSGRPVEPVADEGA